MNTMLEKIEGAQSEAEMCILLGQYLGLKESVPLTILKRVTEDDIFAYRLMTARNHPSMLEVLFNDPHNRDYELDEDSPDLQKQLFQDKRNEAYQKTDVSVPKTDGARDTTDAKGSAAIAAPPGVPDRSNMELMSKATKALFAWGKTGFQRADEATIERRWAACQACEFLTDPPQTMMYQGIKLLAGKETKICSACGCAANKKVMLPTEKCPKQDPENPELSRWGEPWIVTKH